MRASVLYKILFLAVTVVIALVITSCSSKESIKTPKPAGDKTLSFYDNESNGERTFYEVTYDRNNRIVSLYKDGTEVPSSEYEDYSDLVEEKLDEIRPESGHRHVYRFDVNRDLPDLHFFDDEYLDDNSADSIGKHKRIRIKRFDDSTFQESMRKFREELPRMKEFYVQKWNDSTFKEDMKRMKEDLAKLKDVKIKLNFDSDKFRKEMEIFRKEMKDLKLNENLKELNEELRKMADEIKEMNFDELEKLEIEIPEIDIELKDLDRKMSKLDKEMSGLKVELKKLDDFMGDVRKELYKDKLIESEDEDFSMTLRSDSMKINGKDIPSDLLTKYKELYRKNFGKELKDHERFEIDN